MNRTRQFLKVKQEPGSAGRLAAAMITLVMLSACASAPLPPTAELQAAESAIADADRAGVADYALPELTEAREKMNAARIAVQDKEMNLALRLAEQSRVDAELASAKTELAKAQAVNDQMLKSIEILKEEMQRNTGANQ